MSEEFIVELSFMLFNLLRYRRTYHLAHYFIDCFVILIFDDNYYEFGFNTCNAENIDFDKIFSA